MMAAAGSATVGALIAGPVRPGVMLASFPTAVYLRMFDGSVIAVLTQDATRIPCGLVLAAPSAARPLDRAGGPVFVGRGQVRIGSMTVRMTGIVPCDAPKGVTAHPGQVSRAGTELAAVCFDEHNPDLIDILRSGQCEAAAAHLAGSLVGAGSGLTPSGDDLLAGFFVGARSFGVRAHRLRDAVLTRPPGATTDLSSALLGYAAQGESNPEVSAFVLALSGIHPGRDGALRDLLQVGHTSGIALATGVHAAAVVSLLDTQRTAAPPPQRTPSPLDRSGQAHK